MPSSCNLQGAFFMLMLLQIQRIFFVSFFYSFLLPFHLVKEKVVLETFFEKKKKIWSPHSPKEPHFLRGVSMGIGQGGSTRRKGNF